MKLMKNPLKVFALFLLAYIAFLAFLVGSVAHLLNEYNAAVRERGSTPARELGNGVGQLWGEFNQGVNESK